MIKLFETVVAPVYVEHTCPILASATEAVTCVTAMTDCSLAKLAWKTERTSLCVNGASEKHFGPSRPDQEGLAI